MKRRSVWVGLFGITDDQLGAVFGLDFEQRTCQLRLSGFVERLHSIAKGFSLIGLQRFDQWSQLTTLGGFEKAQPVQVAGIVCPLRRSNAFGECPASGV